MNEPVFYIYAPSYDENIGGTIVLHKLCDLINRNGGKAYLYPFGSNLNFGKLQNRSFSFIIAFLNKVKIRKNFRTFSKFDTPIAFIFSRKDAIAVYPEIVSGNPLGADNVVRWLLHKPGFHTGSIEFNSDDLIFYFQEVFDEPNLKIRVGGKLQVANIRTDIYSQTNFGSRHGTCYLLRKGKGREILHDLSNSTNIDDLSHAEIAKIFNQSEAFISYDPYTLYSQYAAICGCISIVVPETGVCMETWQPIEALRYGISYGFDNIEFAKETQSKVHEYLVSLEGKYGHAVSEFMNICIRYFSNRGETF